MSFAQLAIKKKVKGRVLILCYVPESRSNPLVHFNESIKTEEKRREKKRQEENYLTRVPPPYAFLPDRAALPPAGMTATRVQIGTLVTLPPSLRGPGPPGLVRLVYRHRDDPVQIDHSALLQPRYSIASGVRVDLGTFCGRPGVCRGHS